MKRIREPFGKAGLIVAVVALVAAMVGGAYAANSASTSGKRHSKKAHHKKKKSKYVVTKLNQIKPNVQKQLKGNSGPAGPQGPAGGKGDNGSNGSNGSDGAQGEKGEKGDQGIQGIQGIQGPKGDEGSPWTAGGTLPEGASETGAWSATVGPTTSSVEFPVSISFPIPLAEGGIGKAVYFDAEEVEEEEFTNGCSWELFNVNATPESTEPGTLCVFEDHGENITFGFFQTPGESFEQGYSTSGAYLHLTKSTTGASLLGEAVGTWAVSAPEVPVP